MTPLTPSTPSSLGSQPGTSGHSYLLSLCLLFLYLWALCLKSSVVWTPTQATSLPNTFPWSPWCEAMPPTYTLVGCCGPCSPLPGPSQSRCSRPKTFSGHPWGPSAAFPGHAFPGGLSCPQSPHTSPTGLYHILSHNHPHVEQCPPTNWALLLLAVSHFPHQVCSVENSPKHTQLKSEIWSKPLILQHRKGVVKK